jgi:hypothetical protein
MGERVRIKTVVTVTLTLFCLFSLFWIVRSDVFPSEELVNSNEPQTEAFISTTQPVNETSQSNALKTSTAKAVDTSTSQNTGMLGDKPNIEEPEKTKKTFITAYYFHTTRR